MLNSNVFLESMRRRQHEWRSRKRKFYRIIALRDNKPQRTAKNKKRNVVK